LALTGPTKHTTNAKATSKVFTAVGTFYLLCNRCFRLQPAVLPLRFIDLKKANIGHLSHTYFNIFKALESMFSPATFGIKWKSLQPDYENTDVFAVFLELLMLC
jgi:hypothetical protein